MADESRIVQLIIKQLYHNLSVREKDELEAWINESPENRKFMETRMQPEQVIAGMKILLEKDDPAIHHKFEALSQPALPATPVAHPRIRYIGITAWIAISAALMIVFIGGINFWLTHEKKAIRPQAPYLGDQLEKIRKSTDSARLTLPDGETVFPNENTKGKVWESGGWRISQINTQALIYAVSPGVTPGEKKSGPGWISLSIPYGQTWEISLPDGTHIQLSTGSSLSYPANVSGMPAEKRSLVLRGEAWFEVTINPQAPFIVATQKGTTTALGTSFDIRDYAQEDSFRVTLVTGSVNVRNGKDSIKLEPGEEASANSFSSDLQIATDIDLEKRLKWRSPYFDLTGRTIPQVMQQLTEWYNMQGTIFQGKVDTVSLEILGGGHVAKDMPLPILLSKLLKRGDLDFRIEDKKIVINPK